MLKKMKRFMLLAMVLCILVSVSILPASAEQIDSGWCGDDVIWVLEDDGTLTISGTGPMSGWLTWNDHKQDIVNVIIEEGVTGICSSAFSGCSNLVSVSLPNTLETIEGWAFDSTGLKSVTIPSSVTSISGYAFSQCRALESINVASGNTAYASDKGVLLTKDMKTLILCPAGFVGTYTVPDTVTTVSKSAFAYTTALTGVQFPDSVTNMGESMFMYSTSIRNVKLPANMTELGYAFFEGCTSLESVTLPAKLEIIGGYAFSLSSNLKSITIPKSVTKIGFSCFTGCTSLESISVESGSTAFVSDHGVLYTADMTTLMAGPGGFKGDYTIPDGVTGVRSEAFLQCAGLTSIVIPDSVTFVDSHAFEECTGLKSVRLSKNATSITYNCFRKCTSLENVVIPEGVELVILGAFNECTSLKTVVIPKSVSRIDDSVFGLCDSLETFYYAGTEEEWEALKSTSGYNPYFDEVTVICNYVAAPDAPVVSASCVVASGKPKLTWSAVEGAVSYNVYRATSKTGTYSLMKNTASTSYTNTSAVAGKTYYYKVVAVGENDALSEASAIKTITCDLAQPVVKATNVAATGYNKLTWEAIPGATAYKVYRSTSKTGTYTLMKTVKDGTSYVNSNAVAGTTYYYYVVAVMDGKDAATSAPSEIKISTCDLAQPVVKATNVASTGYNKLTWEAIPGATAYKVYRSTSKTGTYTLMKTVKDATSYVNSNAVAGTTYYYYVVAVMDGKDAATSAKSEIKVSTCELPQPTMTLTAGTGKITVKWEKVEKATGYKIYRATSKDGTYTLVKTITSGDTVSWSNTGLTAGKKYYYKMVAILDGKDAATSAYSAVKYTTVK